MSPAVVIEARSRTAARWRRHPTTSALLVAGAVALAWTSGIHLRLWSLGYRHIPTIGPLFLMQGIVASLLALVVLGLGVSRVLPWANDSSRGVLVSAGVAAGSALFLLATLGGFFMSDWFGLFGLHDHLDSAYAGLSLVVECSGAVILLAAAGNALRGSGLPGRRHGGNSA
ncbi:MAG TPA: hypothetical protein VKR22_04105 [Acidimicrobiales bacterium]|nr:hypothetical protein [Acidimicrobiales bacterium]